MGRGLLNTVVLNVTCMTDSTHYAKDRPISTICFYELSFRA